MVVDAQPGTLTADASREVLRRIRRYVHAAVYDAYLLATYFAPESSMFARQSGWTLDRAQAGGSDGEIATLVRATAKPLLEVEKTVRSVLKGDGTGRVLDFLAENGIDELHLVGFDVNDCVLATAFDAIDRDFFVFALEELVFRADGDARLVEAGLTVLRHQKMTNRTQSFATLEVPLQPLGPAGVAGTLRSRNEASMTTLSNRLKDPSLLRGQAFVGGRWVDAGGTIEVADPATGDVVASVPDCGAAETRQAIEAAAEAFPAWRRTPSAERARILERWNDLIVENADDLAAIMTAEQGKPLAEARGEALYGASFAKWFAEETRRVYGDAFVGPAGDRRILVLKEPVGVCAAITPWNFPIAMITRKVAPAFAAGCPIVVKPADLTPLSALALAVLAERAGVPGGVLSVVTGQAQAIGAEMTGNETVRKLSFTGSTPVGRLLMEQSARTIKRLSLELGGNAPFIVFDDADLDQAVAGAMASKFRNAGQTCVCANRILVQDGIHDRFAERLSAEVAKLRLGNGFEKGVTLGPLINDAAAQKVTRHLEDALSKGARLIQGSAGAADGRFVTPGVLVGADTSMLLANEETFGPLAPLMRFSGEEEAVAIANATPFGLASYFYTRDVSRAWRVGEALEFGMVGLNTGSVSMEAAPFGGVKQSGLGREGSAYGIDEYLELKAFHMGGL